MSSLQTWVIIITHNKHNFLEHWNVLKWPISILSCTHSSQLTPIFMQHPPHTQVPVTLGLICTCIKALMWFLFELWGSLDLYLRHLGCTTLCGTFPPCLYITVFFLHPYYLQSQLGKNSSDLNSLVCSYLFSDALLSSFKSDFSLVDNSAFYILPVFTLVSQVMYFPKRILFQNFICNLYPNDSWSHIHFTP